jgi:hypothetical protein
MWSLFEDMCHYCCIIVTNVKNETVHVFQLFVIDYKVLLPVTLLGKHDMQSVVVHAGQSSKTHKEDCKQEIIINTKSKNLLDMSDIVKKDKHRTPCIH